MRSLALSSAVALLAALLPTTLAQTFSDCNPLNTTGCPNMPALGGNATFKFNETWDSELWVKKNQGEAKWTSNGTAFSVEFEKDAPYIQSSFYLFFGHVEMHVRAAPGQGIISSAIMQSETLDEIDWEFKGTNTTHVMTNYFGKGNRTMGDRGADFKMDSAPQDDFHNYTVDWTKERMQWWLDGKQLREVKFADALNGDNYPQTPMNIRIGAWSGGDEKNNPKETVEWAGGPTDFSKGPFTMMVKYVYAKDYTTAKEYSWENMDKSGSFKKVKIVDEGQKSDTIKEIESPHGVKNRWNALSKTAKIAIIASIIGAVVIIACIITFCCIKQRRAGAREYAAFQAEQNKEAAELVTHKQTWAATHRANGGYGRI